MPKYITLQSQDIDLNSQNGKMIVKDIQDEGPFVDSNYIEIGYIKNDAADNYLQFWIKNGNTAPKETESVIELTGKFFPTIQIDGVSYELN